ncbi:polysaccharide deacetylase family protein [Paenibacillus sp. P25]|nr:polysaccharide deacetylase family protein [Paenibacillus sp. P25]
MKPRIFLKLLFSLFVASLTTAAVSAPRSEVVSKIETDQKWIAITFDDGPNPVYTPQILDLLKQYNAKATFFVLGKRVQMYPAIAIREVNEGHEIANHTFDHHFLKNYPAQKLVDEIRQTQEVIFDITEQMPHVFRPRADFITTLCSIR